MPCLSNAISSDKKIRSAKRRGKGVARKVSTRTRVNASDNFLKQRFYPISAFWIASGIHASEIEQQYLQSLKYLCKIYPCTETVFSPVYFPMNIYQHFQEFKIGFEQQYSLETFISGTIEHPCLVTAKALDIGYQLYYVPLVPLQKLLLNSSTLDLAYLVCSAYHYLFKAGVSLCDSRSFIGYEMQMIRDSYADNADESDSSALEELVKEADEIISACEMCCKEMAKPHHGALFGERLQSFQADDQQVNVVKAISNLYELKQTFPYSRFTDRVPTDDKDEEAVMFPEQYLSFFWGGDTSFDDHLLEWIDSSLQEISVVKSPVSVQVFNTTHKAANHEFIFEERFLKGIEQLNSALYEFTR